MTFDTTNHHYNLPPDDGFNGGELPPKKVIIKPVIKTPTRIAICAVLFAISAGSVIAINHQNKKDNFTVTAPQIATTPAPDATTAPAESEPDTGLESEEIPGRLNEHEPDKKTALNNLLAEATKQLQNHMYSRKNHLLRKAGDKVRDGGRSYEYYLMGEVERIKAELKKELIKNNTNSISGVGGEFSADAEDSQRVRALFGDLIAVGLALQYIYDAPAEAVPDADGLTQRVSIGETLDLLLDYEVTAKKDMQRAIFNTIERANTSTTTTKELNQDGKELVESLGGKDGK